MLNLIYRESWMDVTCPDDDTLALYSDAALAAGPSTVVGEHLDTCDSCRRLVAEMVLASSAEEAASGSFPAPIRGRYRRLRLLGAGGLGVVYEAEDRQIGGRVAIKTLRELHPCTLLHLKDEFRVLADIQRPWGQRRSGFVPTGGELVQRRADRGPDLLRDAVRARASRSIRPTSQAGTERKRADSVMS